MSRLIGGLGLAVVLGLASATARAEDGAVAAPAAAPERDDDVDQMVAAFGGVAAGGRTTPGGVVVAGEHLYRLTDYDWLASSVDFTFGGGDAGCFRDRDDAVVCEHGVLDGFAAELAIGLRRHLAAHGRVTPYVKLGLGVRLVSYAADDLRGVAFPLIAGGGVRTRVAPHVQLLGAATLRAGLGKFGRGVDAEPHLSLALLAGVEFELH
jgi:hypothetical protein